MPEPEKRGLLDMLRGLLDKPKPTDDKDPPAPAPESVPYMRVWLLLRKIDIKQLWPVIFSVPLLVFFALSGAIAWFVILIRFICSVWGIFS